MNGYAMHNKPHWFLLTAFSVSLAALAIFARFGEAAQKPFQIVTSFYPIYVATLNVTRGISGVTVANLTQPLTGCLHDYQMTTEDMRHLAGANIFVVNGAGMESFLDKVIKQLPQLAIVDASRGIERIKDPETKAFNPHLWVSISLHIQQIQNIASQLSLVDRAHADGYAKNAANYVGRLAKLRREMHQGLRELRTRDIITFHEAFPYFAKEFGLRIAAVIEREPGSQPNAREMATIVELVRRSKVRALFVEPQYPYKAAQTIARETGAKIFNLDPAVSGPMDPDAYERIMRKNLAELQKALK